mgnify:FL=1
MKFEKLNVQRIVFVFLIFILLFIFIIYVCFSLPRITQRPTIKDSSKSHHVLIIGEAQNKSFLQRVLTGAKEASENYDCVIELLVPKSYAAEESIDSLFEYATFIEPDGIIACIPETFFPSEPLVNSKGKAIPLITLSNYNAELEQVAYIGTNQSELGRKIALEGASYLSKGGKAQGSVAVVSLTHDFRVNYSTLMNSLTNSLLKYKDIQTSVLDYANGREFLAKEDIDLIICPSSEDTIKVAQLVTELHKEGKVGIIGFGSGEILETYLQKGTITELLSIDCESMGKSAINELFSYLNTGYANSYVMSGLEIKRSEKK